MRLVLASASPARLTTLRRAGLDPEVVVSGVDEDALVEALEHPLPPAEHALFLARAKGEDVAARVGGTGLVVGCDSVLELDGQTYGKPYEPDVARARWRRMRGRSGVLHTGHHLVDLTSGAHVSRTASTTVHFADLGDAEIDAYVATGEPLQVAGSFTVDGVGGPFVTGIEGDYHAVVGISLPLLREMVIALGHGWFDLDRAAPAAP